MSNRSLFVAGSFLCLPVTLATAGVISLGSLHHPVVEPFEKIIGVDVPAGLFGGQMYGVPPAGFVMPSGLRFITPDPNPPEGTEFIIGDFLSNQGAGDYGLGTNGVILGPEDLRSGTAFGASGTTGRTFGFEFPSPVENFGVFASGAIAGGEDGRVTLTTYAPDGKLIESVTFDTLPVPFTDDNFIGLGGKGPIGRFEIGTTNSHFAFDDVVWESTCPADIDGSDAVDFGDILAILEAWGPCEDHCPEDLDGNGDVGFSDILIVLASWGLCP